MGSRIALVSGGAGGIGAAVARRLADDGLDVHVLDLAAAAGAGSLTSHVADVADEAEVRRTVAEVGPVDVLVNAAGIHGGNALSWDLPDGRFERIVAVNLAGTWYLCRAVLPGMVERGWGRVVNVSSIAGRDGAAGSAAYAASKAGVIGMTRAMAKEVAGAGVLVNCIAPGVIDTPLSAGSSNRDRAVAATPQGRIGRPEEVAAMVSWLCSDECSFSTGTVFDISGGRAPW